MDVQLSVRGPRVLVKAEDQKETTTGTGVIAVRQSSPDVIGTVVAIGDYVTDVHVDDMVLFAPSAGQVMDFGGEKYLILDESEILAVWDEENDPV